MDALRRVNREDGITVLSNLHHLDTARDYCDRIVAMQSGRVVFDGPPAELTAARVRDVYGVAEAEFEEQAAAALRRPPPPPPTERGARPRRRGLTIREPRPCSPAATFRRRRCSPPALSPRRAPRRPSPTCAARSTRTCDADARPPRLGGAGAADPHRPARRRERGRPARPLRRLPQADGSDLRRAGAPLRRLRLCRRDPGLRRQADRDGEPRRLRLCRRLARHQWRHRAVRGAGGGGRLHLLCLRHAGPRRQRHHRPRAACAARASPGPTRTPPPAT